MQACARYLRGRMPYGELKPLHQQEIFGPVGQDKYLVFLHGERVASSTEMEKGLVQRMVCSTERRTTPSLGGRFCFDRSTKMAEVQPMDLSLSLSPLLGFLDPGVWYTRASQSQLRTGERFVG